MSDIPLSGKVGLDTTDFKTAIAEMNRDIRIIESGFRATAAALGDWSNTASGLEARIKALNGQIDAQQRKVNALQGEYERIAAEKGATSRAAEELQIKLNKETETLNKMKTELTQSEKSLKEMGQASGETGQNLDQLKEKEDQTASSTSKLSAVLDGLGKVAKAGAALVAGLAAAVAGVVAGVTGMVLKTAEASGQLVDLSAQTGLSVERLQELAFVGDQVGVSTDTVTKSMARMIRSMSDARDGTGDAKDAFRELGISITDSNGQLRDSEAVFAEVLDALGTVSNETERDALAMQLFGRSATELNPLIKTGSEEIARLADQARLMGAVMSEEDVMAMEAFGDELAGLQAGLKGTLGTLSTAFLPGFQSLAGQAKGYLAQFVGVVKESDGDLGKVAQGAGGILGQIIGDTAKQAPEMLQAGLNIIQGLINAVVTQLPALIPAAVSLISSLVQFIVQNLPILIQAGIEILLALINGLVGQLPMLIEAALQMIITLANGLTQAIPQLLPVIIGIIPQIVLTLIQNLPLLINAGLQLILALVQGLVSSIPILIPYIPQIVAAIFDAFVTALPMIADAAVQLIMTLVAGIIGALPALGEAAVNTIQAYVDGYKALASTIQEVGTNIVNGVWEGIQARADWFKDQVLAFFQNIIDGVKKALGIESPSKVFAGIGENMAAGLGVGFAGEFQQIERQIKGAIGGLVESPNFTVSASAAKGVESRASNTYIFNFKDTTLTENELTRILERQELLYGA